MLYFDQFDAHLTAKDMMCVFPAQATQRHTSCSYSASQLGFLILDFVKTKVHLQAANHRSFDPRSSTLHIRCIVRALGCLPYITMSDR